MHRRYALLAPTFDSEKSKILNFYKDFFFLNQRKIKILKGPLTKGIPDWPYDVFFLALVMSIFARIENLDEKCLDRRLVFSNRYLFSGSL